MKECVVAMDQGSSSSRALAFDSRGGILAQSRSPVATRRKNDLRAEQDAEEILNSQSLALRRTLSALGDPRRVRGIGLAAQRSTVVFWDKDSGRPVCPALSWQDGRAAQICDGHREHLESVFEKTGLVLNPYYSACKMQWVLRHVPRARRLLERGRLLAGPVSSYLVWHLTRGEVFGVDPSMAQRTLLFNIHTLDWDEFLLSLFGIPRSILPPVRLSGGAWGEFRERGVRIPILCTLGDQQGAVLGARCLSPGQALLSHGTGAFLLLNTGAELCRVPGLLTSVGWSVSRGLSAAAPGSSAAGAMRACYLLEGTVHAVAPGYQWLGRNFGWLKDNGEVDGLCRRSKRRVWVLNALGGLGAPRWDYRVPTQFYGLGPETVSADIVRGATECIGFLIADIAARMSESGQKIATLSAAGGISRVDYLLQFEADLLQREVVRPPEAELTALGAAHLAAQAAGLPFDSGGALKRARRFRPKISGDEARALHGRWRRFVEGARALSERMESGL
ncbi:MAG: hypothetical protein A3G41_03900 [Elusimicrobia bacterium RIFCSPLOWO2_12_FULL_59_9]|nr:MAG: hypothetical protein A3G41_03900 [Elusimicrobia bacterium RIFCSPLOWO2_12_FULL_59_9]